MKDSYPYKNIAVSAIHRGFEFVWSHLTMANVSCYWRKLLTEYAELMTWTVSGDFSLKAIFC